MLARSHSVIRRLRMLRSDSARRRAEGSVVAEGPRLVREAIEAAPGIELVVHAPELAERPEGADLLARARSRGVRVEQTSRAILDALQDARSPQPVVALVRWRTASPDEVIDAAGPGALLAVTVGVQDPGNLGAIVRTAAAAGADGMIAAGCTADPAHPRAIRASAGALFRVPVATGGIDPVLEALGRRGVRTVGTVPANAPDYRNETYSRPVAVVLGGEGAGLDGEVRDRMDATVMIPMAPGIESLSVGAAAAVLLFEAGLRRS